MSLRCSFRLRTLLLLVAAAALSCAVGRHFIPKCDHIVVFTPTFRGPFESRIVEDAVIKSCADGDQDKRQHYVDLYLLSEQIPWVRRGLSARISDLRSRAKVADGQITAIGIKPVLPPWFINGSMIFYPVRVDITALKSRIRDGQQVEVCIQVLKQKDALQVPVNSVLEVANNFFVIVKKGWHFEPRRIRVQAYNARTVVVDESLSDPLPVGACVITKPRRWITALRRHVEATGKIDGALGQRVRLNDNCPSCHWRIAWRALLDR